MVLGVLAAFAAVVIVAGGALLYLLARSAHRGAMFLLHNPVSERRAGATMSDEADFDAQVARHGLEAFAAEPVRLVTDDGMALAARWYPPGHGAAVIFVHGFRADASTMVGHAAPLIRSGYGALLLDLRAHGASDGEQLTHGHRETADLRAATEFVLARSDVDPDRIGMLGCSMGGVLVVLHAAADDRIGAVATDSAYARFDADLMRNFLGFKPPRTWLALRVVERSLGVDMGSIAAEDRIVEIGPRPVLLMSGGRDGNIPADSARRLHDAAAEPKTLWAEPELGHVAFADSAPDYPARIVAFFDRHLRRVDETSS